MKSMSSAELLRVSASALTRHKMRAFLTLLGVIIGVATVVGVVSVISGLNSYVNDKVIGLNPDIVIFTKYGIITSREEWLIARKRRDITLTDMEIIRRECRLCEQVGGRGDRTRPVKYLDRKLADAGFPSFLGTSRTTSAWIGIAVAPSFRPVRMSAVTENPGRIVSGGLVTRSFTLKLIASEPCVSESRSGSFFAMGEDPTSVTTPSNVRLG